MKVALIAPLYTANIVKDIVDKNIVDIDLDIIVYSNYLKAVEIVKKSQKKYDALMFAGVVVYKFVKLYVKEECIWGYFPLHESSLSSALLKGLYENKNIKNLSIDTYSKELIKEVYNSIGIDMDEVNLMLYNVKFNNKNTTEDALNFHRNNLKMTKMYVL